MSTEFGAITRSEAAELCKISPAHASRLLRSMRDAKTLELHGTNRAPYHT